MSVRAAAAAALAGLLAIAAACSGAGAGSEEAGALREEPCTGIGIAEARCLRLTVHEDQQTRRGRVIALRIVVLPATSAERAADAVVHLAGGPGQAATEFIGDSALEVSGLRTHRDLVYADQRGTGGSNAILCRFYGPPEDPASYFDAFLPLDKVRACRKEVERTTDPDLYTTRASVADLEAIRVALKYPQLTLVGGSYGTRLAMEYVRHHEARVRAVVLESAVASDQRAPYRFGQLAAAALDGVLDECLADARCGQAFPAIRDEARTVFDRLRKGPVTAVVAHPSAKKPATVTLTRDHVGEAIRYMTYSSIGASRVPLYLHRAYGGDFAPIADFLMRWRLRGTFDGLYLSITCAEDVPFVEDSAATLDDPTYLGGYRVRQQRAACAAWRRGAPVAGGGPVTASTPVLMISGDLDPVTPPGNSDALARTLPNSLHIRIPRGGHSPVGLTNLGCLDTIKRAFIERATPTGLDTRCVADITRSGFATGR